MDIHFCVKLKHLTFFCVFINFDALSQLVHVNHTLNYITIYAGIDFKLAEGTCYV